MSSKQLKATSADNAAKDEEISFSAKLNDFIRKNRIVFLVIGAIVVVAVASIGVASLVRADRLEKSTLALEQLEADFRAWNEAQEADKASKGDAVILASEALSAKYGSNYAALKAYEMKAQILAARLDYAGAEKAYAAIADKAPKSHMAPVALANAAAMAENAGNKDAALSYLDTFDKTYPDALGADRVIFSIGRIHEESKQYDLAMAAYNRLVATGKESDWTKLAHDRIIFLKSQGLAQ